MSMDRKNKKAAQAAASAANSNGSAGREGHRAGRAQRGTGSGSHGAGSRNALLSGSTAPTRSLSASRPLPMKATLSPSTPAPPVQNTDFASFGLPDESNKLPSAPAQGKTSSLLSSEEVTSESNPDAISELARPEDITELGEAGPSPPLATISAPRRSNAQDGKEGVDFGPIGSPPRPVQTAVRIARVNGFSPGTSPKTLDLSTSPFSAPGTQSVFMVQEKEGSDFKTRSGLSASLGALMSWGLESSGATTIRKSTEAMYPINDEVVVEDGELEEFIPSSLTELLTPEERSRRFSRTTSGRPIVATERESFAGQSSTLEGPHHRYSRSVPAPSLLQDLRSIWSEAPETGSNTISVNTGGLGNGTPSSFQSNSGFGARVDDIVAPSNASAAFLPGLHHYINAKSTRSNLTAGMSSLYGHPTGAPASLHTTSVFESAPNGSAMSPPRLNSFAGNSTLDSIADPYAVSRHPSARPIHGGNDGQADIDDRRSGFSPSTRALQAHAPGQSLPQGLAAGYSRIHALPPPPAIPSPSTSGAFSPGRANGFSPSGKGLGHTHSGSLDWHSSSPNTGMIPEHPSPQTTANAQSSNSVSVGGLENMFSRLSYSAAASSKSLHSVSAIGLS